MSASPTVSPYSPNSVINRRKSDNSLDKRSSRIVKNPKSPAPRARYDFQRSPLSPEQDQGRRRPLADINGRNLDFSGIKVTPKRQSSNTLPLNSWASPKTLAQQEQDRRREQHDAANRTFLRSLQPIEDEPGRYYCPERGTVFAKIHCPENATQEIAKIQYYQAFACAGIHIPILRIIDGFIYIELVATSKDTLTPSELLSDPDQPEAKKQKFLDRVADAFALDAFLRTLEVLEGNFDPHYLSTSEGSPIRTKVDLPQAHTPFDLSALFTYRAGHPAFENLTVEDIAQQIRRFPSLTHAPARRLEEYQYLASRFERWFGNELTPQSADSIFAHMYALLEKGLYHHIPASFEIRRNGTINASFKEACEIVDEYTLEQGGNPELWYEFWTKMVQDPTSDEAQAMMFFVYQDIDSDYANAFPEGPEVAEHLAATFAGKYGGPDVVTQTLHIQRAFVQIVLRFCQFGSNGDSTHDEGFGHLYRTTHTFFVRNAERATLSPLKDDNGAIVEGEEGVHIKNKRPYSSASIYPTVAKGRRLTKSNNVDPDRILGLWFLAHAGGASFGKHLHQAEVLFMNHNRGAQDLGKI